MKKVREKKYITLIVIIMLFMSIIGITNIGKIDKYEGKISIKKAYISDMYTSLSANISNIEEENKTISSGYDEVKYKVNYILDEEENVETRNVIINASLDENEKYATFKEITSEKISSEVTEEGKKIQIRIEDVELGKQQEIEIIMQINGAPNGYKIRPNITIKEQTSEISNQIIVDEVEVRTNSLSGIIKDENDIPVSNILVELKKNQEQIKETYTKEDGSYTFSDVEIGTYTVEIDEEVYKKISEEEVEVNGGSNLNIKIQKVEPYKIQTHKYINKITITNLGKTNTYTYGSLQRVAQSVKNLKEMTGEIYYTIVIENTGEKEGIISTIRDELPEGLSFKKEKNPTWEEKDGVLINRIFEGITLRSKEKKEETLVLDIEKTNEAKTYINKVTAIGEVYEKVVFILNNRTYKEIEVAEGEKITEEKINNEAFSGWYTDKNYTNKYNFDNEVTKDLILYGKTNEKHLVTFIDKNPETNEEQELERQTVNDGEKITEPQVEEKVGYNFNHCWMDEEGNLFDINTKIRKDMTLKTCYEKKEYSINFYDYSNEIKKTIKVKYKEKINTEEVPILEEIEGYEFTGWYELTDLISFDFTTLITRNINLYPRKEILTNAVIFNDENRITTFNTVDYGSTIEAIESLGKEGSTFVYWSKDKINAFDFSTPIKETTTLYAVYKVNVYNVVINDKNPETDEIIKYDEQEIEHGQKILRPNDPIHEGYSFTYYEDEQGNIWNFDTEVTRNITLTTRYIINEYTVRFMNEGNLYNSQTVKYKKKVKELDNNPTKSHNIFVGWMKDNQLFDFNTEIKEDITLYSSYEEVERPTINHTPTTWTNSSVDVTINSTHQDYSYKYKIGENTYQDYVEAFKVNENTEIVGYSLKGNIESIAQTHRIKNIDKTIPEIKSLTQEEIGKNSFSISFITKDNESGMGSVSVYLDDLYEADVVYNEQVNPEDEETYIHEEKVGTYTFNNLEENTTYKVKIIAKDMAGNQTESEEIEVTTVGDRVVARIIKYNNEQLEEENYKNLSSIQKGINYNKDGINCNLYQCTIQMLVDHSESSEVVEGQDITLDLNGYTVRGTRDYTILNSGKFTLIDEGATAGSLVNNISSSIKNIDNGILTIGINDEERVVSQTVPNVYGALLAVEKLSGSFNFYDGRLEGLRAIEGTVDDTPYLYNASVSTTDNTEVATLKMISDPEARNKSVYYTKLSTAISSSQNGEKIKKTNLLQNFTNEGNYGFIFDEETNNLISNNNIISTQAISTQEIDLSEYANDQTLYITSYLENGGQGIITVTELETELISDVSQVKEVTSQTEEEIRFKLNAGKKYNVKIEYISSDESLEETNKTNSKMLITNMVLQKYSEDLITATNPQIAAVKNYGFTYDKKTRTLRSDNKYVSPTYAYSYMEIDLTSETENKDLLINAYLDTYNDSSSKAYIYISEELEYYTDSWYYPSNDVNYIAKFELNGDTSKGFAAKVGPYNYTKTLTPGKKYYLQFAFLKNIYGSYPPESVFTSFDCVDQFVIQSIDLVSSINYKNADLKNELEIAEDSKYGTTWNENWNAVEIRDTVVNADVSEDIFHAYYKVDLTNINENMVASVRLNGGSNENFYTVVTDSKNLPDSTNAFKKPNIINIGSDYEMYNVQLKKNKVNYIHFVCQGVPASYDRIYSIEINKGSLLDLDNLQVFSGSPYEINTSDSYNGGNNYAISNVISGSTNDSYLEIDLTNSTTDQYLRINENLMHDNYNYNSYMYITTEKNGKESSYFNDKQFNSLLFIKNYYARGDYNYYYKYGEYNDTKNFVLAHEYDLRDFNYILTKGNKYYIHFVTQNTRNDCNYSLAINSVLLTPVVKHDINIGDIPITKVSAQSDTQETENNSLLLSDDLDNGNTKFIGKDANNYIYFNNELWRIIGIFNTEDENGNSSRRLKIVRNGSIGKYSWDGSTSSNYGYGTNDWSNSDIMKLLNPDYDDKTNGGSLYWNRKSGNCYNGSNTTVECNFTENGLSEASREFVDKVKWNVGQSTQPSSSNSISSYKTAEESNKWLGKVGILSLIDLIYASDYYLPAVSGSPTRNSCLTGTVGFTSNCLKTNNWFYEMLNSNDAWSMMSSTMNPPGYLIFQYNNSDIIYMTGSPQALDIYPTVYLSTKTYITGGDGTIDKPYEIELRSNNNSDEYYGLLDNHEEESSEDDGIVVEEETNDYMLVKKNNVYGFTYDEKTNVFTNNNKNVPNTQSAIVFEFDTSKETQDTILKFNYNQINYNDGTAKSFINLYEGSYVSQNYFPQNISDYHVGLVTDCIYQTKKDKIEITLQPNKKYYLQVLFITQNDNDTYEFSIENEKYDTSVKTYIPKLNEIPDTIELLKNINLDYVLDIEDTRNVILDLNGYQLSTQLDDYVINNNGSLTVIDSKYTTSLESNDLKYQEDLVKYEEDTLEYNEYINSIQYIIDNDYKYKYTKSENVQEFISPAAGTYEIELLNNDGSYEKGTFTLEKDQKIYLYVNKGLYAGTTQSSDYTKYNSNTYIDILLTSFIINTADVNGKKNDPYISINVIDENIKNELLSSSTRDYTVKTKPTEPIYTEVSQNGKIINSNTTAILNNKNAYLDVETGIVQSTSTSNSTYGIENYGAVTLGDYGKAMSSNYGVYNDGILEDGTGFIDYVYAKSETDLSNYSFYSITSESTATVNNNSNNKYNISVIGLSGADIQIDNYSSVYNLNISSGATAVLNNVRNITTADNNGDLNISNSNINCSSYRCLNNKGTITLNNVVSLNSNSGNSIVSSGTATINGGNIDKMDLSGNSTISNDFVGDKLDIYGTANINSATINTINNVTADVTATNLNTNNIVNQSTLILSSFSLTDGNIKNTGTLTINSGRMSSLTNENIDNSAIDNYNILSINNNFTIDNYKVGITNQNGGIITLGLKDNDVNQKIVIKGNENGIVSKGASSYINYYDGKIIAPKNNVLLTRINEIETDYDLDSSITDDIKTVFLSKIDDPNRESVARINNTNYATLTSAFNSVNTSDATQIDIIKEIDTVYSIDISSDKNITLNTNNKTINSFGNNLFNNSGNLIIDNLEENESIINYNGENLINNNGTITIDNIEVSASSPYSYIFVNNGTLNILGGTYSTKENDIVYLDSNKTQYAQYYYPLILNNSDVIITGGIFNNDNTLYKSATIGWKNGNSTSTYRNLANIYTSDMICKTDDYNVCNRMISNNGNMSIYDGEFNSDLALVNSNSLTIYGGTYNGKVASDYVDLSGSSSFYSGSSLNTSTKLFGGEFNSYILNYSGTMTLEGLESENNSIYNYYDMVVTDSNINKSVYNYGDLIINSGNFNDKINNYSGCNLTIENINQNATGNAIESSGSAVIKSGTIKASNIAINATGALKLGVDDNSISVYPDIEGAKGISTDSTLNLKFYDGVVKGNIAIDSKVYIEDYASGYEILTDNVVINSNNYEMKYLGNASLLKNMNTGAEYSDFKTAIGQAGENEKIQLLRTYIMPLDSETLEIDNDTNIIIDLNGYSLSKQNDNILFDVKGKLSLISDNGISTITSSIGTEFIKNSGELTVENIVFKNYENSTKMGTLIDNSNTITMRNFKIYGYGGDVLFNNTGSATMSGDLSAYGTSKAIINSGELGFTAGDIYAEKSTVITNNGTMSIIANINTKENRNLQINSDTIINTNNLEMHHCNVNSASFNIVINSTGTLKLDSCQITSGVHVTINEAYYGGYWYKPSRGIPYQITDSYTDNMIYVTGDTTIDNSVIIRGTPNNFYYGKDKDDNWTIKSTTKLNMNDSEIVSGHDGALYVEGETELNKIVISKVAHLVNDSVGITYTCNGPIHLCTNGLTSEGIWADGDVNIKDSTIDISDVAIQSVGNVSIDGGTYKTTAKTAILNSGSLTIGVDDDNVSTTSPIITAKERALSSTGEVKFYDGILNGTEPTYGKISEVADGYQIIKDGNSKYLSKENLLKIEKSSSDIRYYNDFNAAINDASETETITMLREYTQLSGESAIVIPNNKNITIDLNGNNYLANSVDSIINNGTLTMQNGNVISTSDYFITNNGTLNIDNTLNESDAKIKNNENGILNYYGNGLKQLDNYGIVNIESGKCGIINNYAGTTNIKGGTVSTSDLSHTINNLSILNITGGTLNNDYKSSNGNYIGYIIKDSTAAVTNISGDIIFKRKIFINQYLNEISADIYGKVVFNNFGNNSGYEYNFDLGINYGELEIRNSKLGGALTNNGKLTIENSSTISTLTNKCDNNLELNITDSTVNTFTNECSNKEMMNISNTNIDNLTNKGSIELYNDTIGSINNNQYKFINIISGTVTNGINNDGELVIGELGGVISTTSPSINGSEYGIINSVYGKLYFYDGIISGSITGISGIVSEVEPGYTIKTNTDAENNITSATLKLIGNDEARVAVVNNINFDNLQAAVNYSARNGSPEVTIYADIILDSDLTVTDGITVNINLNGYSITQGDYNISSSIHIIDNTSISGSVIEAVKDVLGMDVRKDIIIYEMSDGSKLQNEEEYKLYKKVEEEYKIMKLDKEAAGKYSIGKDEEEISSIRGRIYINNLTKGEYKLVDTSDREIIFTISEEGKVSSNVKDNTNALTNSKISTAFAELIITIQTGFIRSNLLILLLLLSVITYLLYKLNKKRI